MANVTDPSISNVSGSDPQNLLEYIARQKIYDSRYWKESCFGLTVTDVLERATQDVQCVGHGGTKPTRFLSLCLKLLQLHPDIELVQEAFIDNTHDSSRFKYVRALGCLYVRLMGSRFGNPANVYNTLEPLYRDRCKLRYYSNSEWSLLYFDTYIHQLLTDTHVVGVALPRLPWRKSLVEAGYLPAGPRPTALHDVLTPYIGGDGDDDHHHGNPVEAYLKYKALEEGSEPARALYEQRHPGSLAAAATNCTESLPTNDANDAATELEKSETRRTKKKAKRNYNNLFKKSDDGGGGTVASHGPTTATDHVVAPTAAAAVANDKEYWNTERAKLGLAPLKE